MAQTTKNKSKNSSLVVLGIIIGAGVALNLLLASEPTVESQDLFCTNENEKIFCTDKEQKPFSGTLISKYDNGYVRKKAHYKKGWLDGESKYYFSDGRLQEENHYRAGALEGKSLTYYSYGQVREEHNFKKGNIKHDNMTISIKQH